MAKKLQGGRPNIMKAKFVLVQMIIVTVALMSICFKREQITVDVQNEVRLLPNMSSDGFVIERSNYVNTLGCNIAGVSEICQKMVSDGYTIVSDLSENESVDIILNKEDVSIRLHWNDNYLISIAAPYEKSFIPLTYINEENSDLLY